MPEQKNYNLEEAREEAQKMQNHLEKKYLAKKGRFSAEQYDESEKLVEEKSRLQEKLENRYARGAVFYAEEIIDFAKSKNISLDLTKPKIVSAYQKELANCLARGRIEGAEVVIESSENKNIHLDLTSACQKGLEICLSRRVVWDAEKIIEFAENKNIHLDLTSACQEALESHLAEGYGNRAEQIINFAKSENISLDLTKPEIVSACQKEIENFLFVGYISGAEQVINFAENKNISLDLTKPEIVSACQKGLENRLAYSYISEAEQVINFAENKNISLDLTKPEIVSACQKGLEHCLVIGSIREAEQVIDFAKSENISLDFPKAVNSIILQGHIKTILEMLDQLPVSSLEPLEKEYFLLSYQKDLNLPAESVYQKYIELKKQGDEMQLSGYIEKINQQVEQLISSDKQDPEITEIEDYQGLVKAVYPNHSENWTNFKNNESCTDRSEDLAKFKIEEKYEIDLKEGVEMVLKPGKEKDEETINELEKPISEIQQKFGRVGFEKKKMFEILDQEIEQKITKLPHQEIYKTREEKLYGLLLESLVNRFNPEELKEILIGYQFAEYEDIKTYLEGTRAQAEQAKNPDYAYLLELREFFADRIKEVQRRIVHKAQENPEIMKILPEYYQDKRNQELEKSQKEQISRLRPEEIGLEGNLLERLLKELSRKTDKKGNQFELVQTDKEGNPILDEKGHLIPGKKAEGIAGIISSEQRKAAKALETITGEKTDPENIHLGELNLKELLQAEQTIKEGQYNEELFSRYLLQAFQGVFEKELTTIDKEVAKYEPKEAEKRDKKTKKLECFITKNHTSAHARGVGGVCVSGDNPGKQGEECQWNMPNYFQLVLRDSETKVCQGLVLLHYYEDQGKKILTGAFDPCSTYLYQVDEKQLFKGLLKQLEIFAQDNEIDLVAVSQNKSMRTNRTGGEFERAMENQIRNINQTFSLSKEQIFSYNPEYKQKDLDVVWVKET